MTSEWFLNTDFGMVSLSEPPPEFPTKKFRHTRYDEFTGKPYRVTTEYPDYDSPLGQQWVAYEKHVNTLAQEPWEKGGNCEDMKVPPFSEWMKDRK